VALRFIVEAEPLVASLGRRKVETDAANLKDLMEAYAL
jgi:hypothetical protein